MTIAEVLKIIKSLSQADQKALKEALECSFSCASFESITEKRFSSGMFCPHCNSIHIKRNGHKGNVQRYLCNDCHKTFTIRTNTITTSSKKSFETWNKYIECMMNAYSVRKSAEICEINKDTAFIWRHKILDALQNMATSVKLNGIIEADETFFSISFKGNHKKSVFVMPRKSHKRGKETHLRGISHEKVCVPCAINRNGLSIAKIANLGRVNTKALHKTYGNRIEKGSILCTDVMNAYIPFAASNDLELIQLKTGKAKKGIYHIQHINSYHSTLKHFIDGFRGVSTKYLNNYLIWNNFLNYSKETWLEKKNIFKEFVFTTSKKDLSKKVPMREAVPIVA